MSEPDGASDGGEQSAGVKMAGMLPTLLTLLISLVTAVVSWETNVSVHRSEHAVAFADAFTKQLDKLTQHFKSNRRADEQQADLVLTVLDDLAQTSDDQIAMLTAAARMLNATECPSNGEPTARFLSGVIARLKQDDAHRWFWQSSRTLDYVRSRAFLDLASSDVTTVYYNDHAGYIPPECGGKLAPAPAPSRASAVSRAPARATAPAKSGPPPLPLLPGPPDPGDEENHATWWGEQTAWNEAKNALFRELRPEPYAGWIQVATWEQSDACVDANANVRVHDVRCTPIRVQYTSQAGTFVFTADEKGSPATQDRQPFWLGRPRFLRDAPPVVYVHAGDSALRYRGSLGHVIGVVDYGECVIPLDKRYVAVSPVPGQRAFIHEWVLVTDNGITDSRYDVPCGRSQRPPAGKT